MHTIRLNLAARSYDAVIGPGAAAHLPSLAGRAVPAATRLVILADEALHTLGTAASVADALTPLGIPVDIHTAHADEPSKSMPQAAALAAACQRSRLDRNGVVIALGGGITGDLAGFVAASFKRGVRWINCPTTLLAMVDASVGGKTGVNLIDGDGTIHKNMLGAFHQPSLVVADTGWLATLPPRHARCGMAECIKHALLCRSVPGLTDPDLFQWTLDLFGKGPNLRPDLRTDPAVAELVVRSVTLKARVVEQDERETAPPDVGGRALLNLGHTFAHVIEGLPSAGDVLHGEAVGLGLIAAAHTAHAMGRVDPGYVSAVSGIVAAAGLPTRTPGLPAAPLLIEAMRGDKKSVAGSLRLILPFQQSPGDFGRAAVVADPPPAAVAAGWDALRA